MATSLNDSGPSNTLHPPPPVEKRYPPLPPDSMKTSCFSVFNVNLRFARVYTLPKHLSIAKHLSIPICHNNIILLLWTVHVML